jgi:hypothetical protein
MAAYYSYELDMLISVDEKMSIRFWDLEKKMTLTTLQIKGKNKI